MTANTAEGLHRTMMHRVTDVHFVALDNFKDEIQSRFRELDNKLAEDFEKLRVEAENQELLALHENGFDFWRDELGMHESLMCESLVLVMWHKVENLLKSVIAKGGTTTREARDKMGLGGMRRYFEKAKCPLKNMPQYDEVMDLHDICVSLKHHSGRAKPDWVPKYAQSDRAPLQLTAAHIDEWLSACRTFLHAVVDAAPIAPWKPPSRQD